MKFVPDAISFCEALGLRIGIDLDGELQVSCSRQFTEQDVAAEIMKHAEAATWWVQNRAKRHRSQCVGGPFNGERHGRSHWGAPAFGMRVRRAEWAAYFVEEDGRAFFHGMTTSERKARQLAWSKGHRPLNPNP